MMHVCLQCQKWHHVTIYLAINYCLSYAHSPTPQSKDAIVDSTHPCTREEAIQFAALQCQIQYGNYDEAKHKPGYQDQGNWKEHFHTTSQAAQLEWDRCQGSLYPALQVTQDIWYDLLPGQGKIKSLALDFSLWYISALPQQAGQL